MVFWAESRRPAAAYSAFLSSQYLWVISVDFKRRRLKGEISRLCRPPLAYFEVCAEHGNFFSVHLLLESERSAFARKVDCDNRHVWAEIDLAGSKEGGLAVELHAQSAISKAR